MKRILYLIMLISVVGCTYDSPPEELAPYYMFKYSDGPGWSSKSDFLKLNMDGNSIDRTYGPNSVDNLILPTKSLGYWGGKNIDGAYMFLGSPNNGELYPNAPFKIGDEWTFNDSTTIPISGVYMNGLGVSIVLPKPFEKNLKYGFYKLITNRTLVGASLECKWTIKGEDALGNLHWRNYLLKMQPKGIRKVEIIGIDSSNAKEIRITAAFEGLFAADRYLVKEFGKEYEIAANGSFSYAVQR